MGRSDHKPYKLPKSSGYATSRKRKAKKPDRKIFLALLKFIASALFGGFISFIIFWFFFYHEEFWTKGFYHVLWIIPLIWGVWGIFWFDKMLDSAAKMFEDFLDYFR